MLVKIPRRLFSVIAYAITVLALYHFGPSILGRIWHSFTSIFPGTEHGAAKPIGPSYTKTLVIPKTKKEDTKWVDEHFGPDSGVRSIIYVVDDPKAPFHPPKNKGHEAMVYLSYIIDHYENLSDINIFMHAHRHAWHINELFDNDAVQLVGRLSAERVQREGYMNLRCHWYPGCPEWMHPGTLEEDVNKKEEKLIAIAWLELFPLDPMPQVLAQPCCSQFAISRDRIMTLPKSKYVSYRDWLLQTPLSDEISGRVWEYIWQYLFTGKSVVCPVESVCYCDGFGLCFGTEDGYINWRTKLNDKRHYEDELVQWNILHEKTKLAKEDGRLSEAEEMQKPEEGKNEELRKQISNLEVWLGIEKEQAKIRGDVAMNRAQEAGRPWKEGDGF